MKYDMKEPCGECPFRSDKVFPLRYGRVIEITNGLLKKDIPFSCHKTTTGIGKTSKDKDARHCAGALIFCEENGRAHQMMRINERFGDYDHTKLRGHEYVFKDALTMAEKCSEANG